MQKKRETLLTTEFAPNGTLIVKAFQFTVITRHMTEWWNRAVTEEKFRVILARFPQFNATIHDGDSPILNMLLTVKSDMIGSIAVTIVCMAVVCSLFIPDRPSVCAIVLCISSICFNLVGVISWCGADLDPISMVDVLLSTGFSVDYTAHEMGPPMLQAGISTVLCMLPLAFVPTYAIVAFAKTIFAVVSIGLIHGLFFLPILLCALPKRRGERAEEKERVDKREREETGKFGKDQRTELLGESDARRMASNQM